VNYQATKDHLVFLAKFYKFSIQFELDYEDPAIGKQTHLFRSNFISEIANARTFGLMSDVEKLQSMGLALGGTLDNAIVVKDGKVLNKDGLHYDNEFVRHKILDVIGDLALAGSPIVGKEW